MYTTALVDTKAFLVTHVTFHFIKAMETENNKARRYFFVVDGLSKFYKIHLFGIIKEKKKLLLAFLKEIKISAKFLNHKKILEIELMEKYGDFFFLFRISFNL